MASRPDSLRRGRGDCGEGEARTGDASRHRRRPARSDERARGDARRPLADRTCAAPGARSASSPPMPGGGVRRLFLEVNGSRSPRASSMQRCADGSRPAPAAVPARSDRGVRPRHRRRRRFRQGPNRSGRARSTSPTGSERNRACARARVRVDNECPIDSGAEQGACSRPNRRARAAAASTAATAAPRSSGASPTGRAMGSTAPRSASPPEADADGSPERGGRDADDGRRRPLRGPARGRGRAARCASPTGPTPTRRRDDAWRWSPGPAAR